MRALATDLVVQCAIPRPWRAPGGRYATSSPLEIGQGALNLGHATAASKPGASSLRNNNVRFVLTAAPGDGDEVGPRGVHSYMNARRWPLVL